MTKLRGHLQVLYLGYLALGVEDRDARALDVRKTRQSGLAGVSRGRGHDHDPVPALAPRDRHQVWQQLECHVFEGAGGTMGEFEQPVAAQRCERCHGGRIEVLGVGVSHAGADLLGRVVGDERCKHLLGRLVVVLVDHCGHVERLFAELVGYVESPVGCDASQYRLLAR